MKEIYIYINVPNISININNNGYFICTICHSYISNRKEITELGSSNLIGEISSVKVDFSLRQINLRLDFIQHKIPSSAETRINLTSDLRLNGLYNRA